MSEQDSISLLTSALYLLTFTALVAAIQAWGFCFRGKTSAQNQLAQLQTRLEKLESTVGGHTTPDPKPSERDTRYDRVMANLVPTVIGMLLILLALAVLSSFF